VVRVLFLYVVVCMYVRVNVSAWYMCVCVCVRACDMCDMYTHTHTHTQTHTHTSGVDTSPPACCSEGNCPCKVLNLVAFNFGLALQAVGAWRVWRIACANSTHELASPDAYHRFETGMYVYSIQCVCVCMYKYGHMYIIHTYICWYHVHTYIVYVYI
jgi:hypothetical protein